MPNGKRVTQEFSQKDRIQVAYDFVLIQEERGFENEENKFEIISPGFPPKSLSPDDTFSS